MTQKGDDPPRVLPTMTGGPPVGPSTTGNGTPLTAAPPLGVTPTMLPPVSSQLLTSAGSSGVNEMLIEGQILAHRALARIATEIAAATQTVVGSRGVVLLTPNDEDSLNKFRAFQSRALAVVNAYGLIAAEPTVLRQPRMATKDQPEKPTSHATASGWLGLIRDSVDLLGREVRLASDAYTSDDASLVAQIAGRLTKLNVPVLVPSALSTESALSKTCNAMATAHFNAAGRVARVGEDRRAEDAAALARIEKTQLHLEQVLTEPAVSVLLAQGALVEGALTSAQFCLTARVVALGGTTKTTKFLGWTWAQKSGGAIARFMLCTSSGGLALADTRWAHEGWTNFDPRSLSRGNRVADVPGDPLDKPSAYPAIDASDSTTDEISDSAASAS
jgi:hypothetical protein